MAPHSSTLVWKIPWTEEPGRLQSMGSLRVHTTERLHFHFSLSCIGEGNGNPLQCSCLENPRDGGAWWAAIYGVAQNQIWLKWLSSSSSSKRRKSQNFSVLGIQEWFLWLVVLFGDFFFPEGQATWNHEWFFSKSTPQSYAYMLFHSLQVWDKPRAKNLNLKC